jgi:hypothetical protein
MEKLAEVQSESEALEKREFKYIRDGEKQLEHSSDYLDEIFIRIKQLSGIIACLRGIGEREQDNDYSNLAWAIMRFIDDIDMLRSELWDHLAKLGVLQK